MLRTSYAVFMPRPRQAPPAALLAWHRRSRRECFRDLFGQRRDRGCLRNAWAATETRKSCCTCSSSERASGTSAPSRKKLSRSRNWRPSMRCQSPSRRSSTTSCGAASSPCPTAPAAPSPPRRCDRGSVRPIVRLPAPCCARRDPTRRAGQGAERVRASVSTVVLLVCARWQ